MTTEYRFPVSPEDIERAAIGNMTTDMSRAELVKWIMGLKRSHVAIERQLAVTRRVFTDWAQDLRDDGSEAYADIANAVEMLLKIEQVDDEESR